MKWDAASVAALGGLVLSALTLAATGYDLSWRIRTLRRLEQQAALLNALPAGDMASRMRAWIRQDTASLLARREHPNWPAYKWLGWSAPVVAVAFLVANSQDPRRNDDQAQFTIGDLIHHPWWIPANLAVLVAVLGFFARRERLESRRKEMVAKLLADDPPGR